MEAKKSPLNIINFEVLKYNFEVISDEDSTAVVNFDDYTIDFSFDVLEPDEKETADDDSTFIIPIQCKINDAETPLFGYQLSIFAIGSFSINNIKSLKEEEIQNLKIISSINIMISNLRGFLKVATSYGPFNAYLLPSIDMGDLLEKKKKAVIEAEKFSGEN